MSTVGPHFNEVERWCNNAVTLGDGILFTYPESFERMLRTISEKYQFPYKSLHSFLRNISLVHVKRTAPLVKKSLPKYLKQYKNGKSILDLAKDANYPPYLFARYIVEEVAVLTNGKRGITEAMRNPEKQLGNIDAIGKDYIAAEEHYCRKQRERKPQTTTKTTTAATVTTTAATVTTTAAATITTAKTASSTATTTTPPPPPPTTTRLGMEVREAIESDPMYGPKYDKARHLVGIEYEVVLEKALFAMGIPFETESQLRDRGTSRTPDILLSCPLGVAVPTKTKTTGGEEKEWKVVCWIDSKAMFGDEVTHRTSVLPQAESYVHRFGPGLVLYWFGHAPIHRLGDAQGDIIISAWGIPENVMLPTGDSIHNHHNGNVFVSPLTLSPSASRGTT